MNDRFGVTASLSSRFSLKRSAPSSPGQERMSKRSKDEEDQPMLALSQNDLGKGLTGFSEEVESELRCGCCTELAYNPVLVLPCQHFFCGSCLTLWFRNGGTNCPQCRQTSTKAIPFRAIQSLIELLVRTFPDKQRTSREREQADSVYSAGQEIGIPAPVKPQEDTLPHRSLLEDTSAEHFARPCLHCPPNNQFGWQCPQPIADPSTDRENAWNLDNGPPPGHAWCASCDSLHALSSPSSSQCSLCSSTFCGHSIPHLCVAPSIGSGHLPPRISTLAGLIESADIYGVFVGNTVEVDIFFDWIRTAGRTPRGIYLDIINRTRSLPNGFQDLIASGMFVSDRPNPPTRTPNPDPVETRAEPESSPTSSNPPDTANVVQSPIREVNKICRECANGIFFHSLFEWWVTERCRVIEKNAELEAAPAPTVPPSTDDQDEDDEGSDDEDEDERHEGRREGLGSFPAWVISRTSCPDGRACERQLEMSHAKEFNHIVSVPSSVPIPSAVTTTDLEPSSSQATQPLLSHETEVTTEPQAHVV